MDSETPSKNTILFMQLLFMFQAAAMQQMGKIGNPMTGQIERDLEQARVSIDMIEMLRDKCRGNLDDNEQQLISHLLSELRLNYVDEVNRPQTTESAQQSAEHSIPENSN